MLVDRHVGQFGFGHVHYLARIFKARGFDADLDRDRSISGLYYGGVKADQVADIHRLVKHHFAHRDGDKAAVIRPAHGFDRAGLVDITEKHAAEDRALGVGHVRQHRYADRGILIVYHKFQKLTQV